jgi:Ser-tRNA(Ala) deacylase AlaX
MSKLTCKASVKNLMKIMMLVVQDSWPRIVCLGENPGCPCGGTHVADISEIGDVKVAHSTFCVFDITS